MTNKEFSQHLNSESVVLNKTSDKHGMARLPVKLTTLNLKDEIKKLLQTLYLSPQTRKTSKSPLPPPRSGESLESPPSMDHGTHSNSLLLDG